MKERIRKILLESNKEHDLVMRVIDRDFDLFDNEDHIVIDIADFNLTSITNIPNDVIDRINQKRESDVELNNNSLTQIPDFIFELKNLTRLDMSNNPITHIPNELFHNKPIFHHINVLGTNVTDLPDSAIQPETTDTLYITMGVPKLTNNLLAFPEKGKRFLFLEKKIISFNDPHNLYIAKLTGGQIYMAYGNGENFIWLFIEPYINRRELEHVYEYVGRESLDYIAMHGIKAPSYHNFIPLMDLFHNDEMVSSFYNLVMSGQKDNIELARNIASGHGATWLE